MVRTMSESVERSSLDLRYEGYRLRDDAAEARLLASISERGIEEPLGGVDTPQGRLLLDGFRRNRCAAKLGLECVPYVSWGEDEAQGIASLLSARRQRTLSILEQARFVEELLRTQQLTVADVAEMLSRSKGWVSTRRHLLSGMSVTLQQILFRGEFPVYSYMVTLRPFMRVNGVAPREIERFVQALAGAKLSVREIDLLAHGYFRGPSALRQAIDEGRWKWTLDQMQAVPDDPEGLSVGESRLLRELERLLQAMQDVMTRCDSPRLQRTRGSCGGNEPTSPDVGDGSLPLPQTAQARSPASHVALRQLRLHDQAAGPDPATATCFDATCRTKHSRVH